MTQRIGIYLKDERYLASLNDFLTQRLQGVEVVAIRSLREFNEQSDPALTVVIAATLLNEGIWLRVIPVLKKARHIILLAFPGGPEITEDIAQKYGADRLFRVPFPSNELLAAIEETLKEESETEEQYTAPVMAEEMQGLFERLDEMDYYELFGIDKAAEQESIKKNYISLARRYHPDKFRNASPDARRMAYEITKRANEAYSVLSHPNRRKMYEKMQRDNPGTKRFDFRLKMKYEENPHDTIHNQQARRFALLAQKAMDEGQFKQALTQLKMANSMEPGNDYITGLMEEVQNKIAQG